MSRSTACRCLVWLVMWPSLPTLAQPASFPRNPSASGGASQPASYLQYEPQNEPLPDELPPLLSEELSLESGLSTPPAPEPQLPLVAPYGTSLVVSWTSGDGDALGMTDIDFRQTLVFPRRPGFMISPGTSVHFLAGPESVDLPETLYDNWLEFRWLKKFNDRWAMDLAVTPSLYTDYENTSSDAFRMTGRAIAVWTRSPEWQIMMGAVYLDREDIVALPVAGAIWTPNDEYKVELTFPRPRVLKQLAPKGETKRWLYLGGEFGGGSWAIDRADGTPDVFTYSVWRMLVGYETQRGKNFKTRWEAGYVFNRKVEYESGVGDYDPDNAFLLRFGGSF